MPPDELRTWLDLDFTQVEDTTVAFDGKTLQFVAGKMRVRIALSAVQATELLKQIKEGTR